MARVRTYACPSSSLVTAQHRTARGRPLPATTRGVRSSTQRSFCSPTNRREEYGALRILLYAGDQDTVCSAAGISLWLDSMQWRMREDWAPWFVPGEKEAAGRIKLFENGVVFMTVAGAGHEAPAFRPKEALYLFAQFLQGV